MRPRLLLCLALVVAGCAERRFAGPPPPAQSSPPLPSVTASTSAAPGSSERGLSWIDAVRLERWNEAAAGIDALAEGVRARPDMRYVRARAALGAGDGARAGALLDGLEGQLPLLADDIARHRAEAQLLAGPYASAAAYFARSTKARDLARAALAFEKAGDVVAAKKTADRAVARAGSSREEAAARMARAQIAEAHGGASAAEADYRWVAARAPAGVEGRRAAQALERMKRPSPPAAIEPEGTSVEGTIEAPREAPLRGAPLRGAALHARGMALYRARDYLGAAKVLREAAAAKSGHEAEDLHYAARALSRVDHDDEAVKVHRRVARSWPRSPFAARSAYFAARLELTNARYRQAAIAYGELLAARRKGEHRDDAQYERALAQLSSGGAAAARATLSSLARKAPADKASRLRQLAGLAALRSGDRVGAIALWTEVARAQPLTWAGMASRARLASIGASTPPLIEPPIASPAPAPLDLRLPPTPALLASVGLDGDAERHLAASEREVAAPFSGREDEALCGLYGKLSRGKRRLRIARDAVDASWLMRAPSEGERWAWECIYPEPFAGGVRALEEQHGLPRGLIHAVMRQESAFDPAVVSPASAVGLMQLMPATARQAAKELSLELDEADLTRPDINLRLGAFYIAKLMGIFRGNVLLAAAAYNAGPRAVSHWVEAGTDNDLDLWVARIPFDETRNYVAHVAQNLARYQWLLGGDAAVTPATLAMPPDARAPPDAY